MTHTTWTRGMIVLLAAGMLVGLAVRVFHVDHQTITHPEFYVPGIDLPDWVSTPRERMTQYDVLEFALFGDKHPPGYHVLMLGWNKMFGTGTLAMRLSSVLFGIVAVCALPFYVRAYGGRAAMVSAGVLGVWLLALHGFHTTWSQQLRPWGLVGTLGLLTTMLLPALTRRPSTRTVLGYVALASLGLWTEYYFWPLFGVQLAWIVLNEAGRKRWTPALQAILLTGILAAPLSIYAWFHMTGQESHINSATWSHVLMMLEFGRLHPTVRLAERLPQFAPILTIVTAGLGALALGFGLKPWNRPDQQNDAPDDPRLRRRLDAIMAGTAVTVVATTWLVFGGMVGDRKIFKLALAVPFLILAVSWIGRFAWPPVAAGLMRWKAFRWIRDVLADPVTVVPIAAFTGLAVMSQIVPVFALYGLVVFVPLYIVILARGLSRLGRMRGPVIAVVLALFAFSSFEFATTPISAREYKGLALQMIPRMRPGDTVLTQDAWYAAPITYYLKPDQYDVLPPPLTDAARAALPDTLWIVGCGPHAAIDANLRLIEETVPEYVQVERVSTPTSAAGRYVRRSER
jgi:hypothetical protein